MKRQSQCGAIIVEFLITAGVLVPLILGVVGLGLSMHNQLQTVQLARDAGHMFARGVDFTLLGNQQILAQIGGTLNLSTTLGSGNSAVFLSTVRYIDASACQTAGFADKSGNPTQGCTNYGQWVFAKRIAIGNNSYFSSHLGTPSSSIVGSDGSITIANQVTNTTDVSSLTGFNPWNSTTDTGLPSGQVVYVAEVAAKGFQMPPFSAGTDTYSQFCF
jgi:hypothetical protein